MNRNARKNVDYNSFAKDFSESRKNMKWEEISYFLGFLKGSNNNILDIGCGNGRLLEMLKDKVDISNYLGVDLSTLLLEQAKQIHKNFKFKELNMLDLYEIKTKFNYIFFIASFHHLKTLEDRLQCLKDTYLLLEKGGMVFMTNWALDSDINTKKYSKDIIEGSKNKFGSTDYNIKFGNYERFYHCFSTEELKYLSENTQFEIIENKLFNSEKNYILILKKT